MAPSNPSVVLRETFGFDAFRPGQEEAVRAAIGPPARDVLVVMPTGAGKSLCYQLPALVRDDVTLVVSPLVSLMQDQVEALAKLAPGRVALVNSQRDAADNRAALKAAADGELRLLYVAPERFSSAPFLQAMKDIQIGLFVVDEAHCVSQWGHDFRPDYFRLADAARWLQAEAIIASTATATPQVANDISVRLGLRDPVRVATGFDRPNLSFGVIPCASAQAKHRHIASALKEAGATPAIVYAGTRNGAEKLATHLSGNLDGAVAAYHAGLGREQRADVQRRFMDGRLDIVVLVLGERAELWHNQSAPANGWLIVRPVGTKSNRDGIGARVTVGDQVRTMTTAVGYASSSHAGVHFGLGAQAEVPRVEVQWPSGVRQAVENVKANQVIEVREK